MSDPSATVSVLAPENVEPADAGHEMRPKERITYAFNKVLIDFIMSIKHENADLKAMLRKNYKVIDNASEDDIARVASILADDALKSRIVGATDPVSLLSQDLASVEILKDCRLSDIADKLKPDFPRSQLAYYVYFMFLLAMLYTDCADDSLLLEKVLNAVSKVQSGDSSAEDDLDAILDDDVRAMLKHMQVLTDAYASSGGGEDEEQVFETIMESKIGKLAAEISSEIDPTQLDMSNPMDMLDFKKLADGSSPLGGIITKVGSKIQDKIKTGELSQGELLTEAMSMLKMFDKQNMIGNLMSQAQAATSGGDAASPLDAAQMPNMGDMLSQLQGLMKGMPMPGGNHGVNHATRDRLRKKLQDAQGRKK